MNPWDKFIKEIAGQTQVTLVGPMYNQAHTPDGPTVYIDAGADSESHAGANFPTVSVGDGDSTQTKLDVQLPDRKDYSDLSFVLQRLPATLTHVSLLGFLGGRTDHEVVNFGEVHGFLTKRTAFTTVSFDQVVYAFKGGALSMNIRGIFSLLTFAPTLVTCTGACEYEMPMPIRLEILSSLGLSNKGFGQVTIDSLEPCFIFLS